MDVKAINDQEYQSLEIYLKLARSLKVLKSREQVRSYDTVRFSTPSDFSKLYSLSETPHVEQCKLCEDRRQFRTSS